jgi:hypothetical protein
MKTTLNEIKSHNPCLDAWEKLLGNLNKTKADDELLDLITILKSNGIKDAVWALRCFDYLDCCLFLADLAESVLHLFEQNNSSKALRLAIQAMRDYKAGRITRCQLKSASGDACAADADAYDYAASAAAHTVVVASDAGRASIIARDAAHATVAASTAHAADAREEKWNEIEALFTKHFGGVEK